MKYIQHCLKTLTTATAAIVMVGMPLVSKEARATSTMPPTPEVAPVQIYVPPPERRTDGICPDLLAPALNSIVESPAFARGRWGVLVEDMSSNQTLYSRSANTLFIPASNVKLLTTAAALQRFDTLSVIGSTSLGNWIRITNLDSNNGYADGLLQRLGGPRAVRESLTLLGVDPNSYRQVDGSGLSRQNQASPTAFISTLKAMRSAQGSDVFYGSLPVAGVNGTLRNRFRNTPAQGVVHAKTGTLSGVRALSGYVDNRDYGTLAFSIMANQSDQPGEALVGAIDRVVLQLTRLTRCN
ncbi:D-alanyl-D-alanine carboxypeptidase [Oculatella sp. LEGE 06141]|uniref:D-alanyl-D-alanine carboxypeptidase n=1 Tax=Oculatella sp. LEGE 06141 TaxID=1828648 RepID=UPI0018815906|nr:D-alanyl-D-alanine carboxypeptidase [Oculatella sp. LEGE 06141]MBE9180105.1 D-alanyl-D-alanine carboxypeptidase [Oculatella sp. LEGE 06141]